MLGRHLGIWELDEFAFNTVAPKLKPDTVVFLNVFRDQLDRYGEVDTVVKRWCNTLKSLDPKTLVLVNGDDGNTLKLKDCFQGKVYTFGVEDFKIKGESLKKSKHHPLDFEARDVKLNGLSGSSFAISFNYQPSIFHLPIPGLYHIYDAVAALSAVHLLNLLTHRYTDILKTFQPAFGRVEKLPFGHILLIKNPAGATQVFQTIAPIINNHDRLLLALNDNLADGTDVSWIWDADWEILTGSDKVQIICSGTRAEDMALRLKYAGFNPKLIVVESDLKKALKRARKGLKGQIYILPTYTAMIKLQRILADSGIKKNYWDEA